MPVGKGSIQRATKTLQEEKKAPAKKAAPAAAEKKAPAAKKAAKPAVKKTAAAKKTPAAAKETAPKAAEKKTYTSVSHIYSALPVHLL